MTTPAPRDPGAPLPTSLLVVLLHLLFKLCQGQAQSLKLVVPENPAVPTAPCVCRHPAHLSLLHNVLPQAQPPPYSLTGDRFSLLAVPRAYVFHRNKKHLFLEGKEHFILEGEVYPVACGRAEKNHVETMGGGLTLASPPWFLQRWGPSSDHHVLTEAKRNV